MLAQAAPLASYSDSGRLEHCVALGATQSAFEDFYWDPATLPNIFVLAGLVALLHQPPYQRTMCRVAVRQGEGPLRSWRTPCSGRQRADEPNPRLSLPSAAPRAGGEVLYEETGGFAAAVSFEDLFSGEGALDLDDSGALGSNLARPLMTHRCPTRETSAHLSPPPDLDLLKMFNSASADPVSAEASASAAPAVSASPEYTTTEAATLGQAVEAGAASYSAGGMDAVQQLQMQAVLQQQAAITATGSAPLYQQALMQQMLMAQGSFGAPASSAGAPSAHVMAPAAVASMPVAASVHHGKRQKVCSGSRSRAERWIAAARCLLALVHAAHPLKSGPLHHPLGPATCRPRRRLRSRLSGPRSGGVRVHSAAASARTATCAAWRLRTRR